MKIDKVAPNLVVNSHDRFLAIAAHGTSVFFPIFGPLVTLLLSKKSLYGRFHAWRALIGDLKLVAITVIIVAISIGHSIVMLIENYKSGALTGDPWQLVLNFLIKSLIVWLILGAFQLVNTISSVLEALQAARKDHWPVKSSTDKFSAKMSRLKGPVDHKSLES